MHTRMHIDSCTYEFGAMWTTYGLRKNVTLVGCRKFTRLPINVVSVNETRIQIIDYYNIRPDGFNIIQ